MHDHCVQVKEAQSFIHKNLVPKITGGVESKIEICHFGTDTDAVGEVRFPRLVCQAMHKTFSRPVFMCLH